MRDQALAFNFGDLYPDLDFIVDSFMPTTVDMFGSADGCFGFGLPTDEPLSFYSQV